MPPDTEYGRDARERIGRSTGVTSWLVDRIERLSDTQFVYILLTPSLLLLAIVAFWPLLRTFEMSLHADAVVGSAIVGEFVGFQTYAKLLTGQFDPILVRPFLPDVSITSSFPFVSVGSNLLFGSALAVTFIFTVVSVAIETLIGFGQALVLDKEFRGRRWLRVAIILPFSVPIVIQGMIFYLMFLPGVGFAVEPLQQLNLISSTPLTDTGDSMLLLIAADVWKTSAFMALLILAGLQSINRDLYSVAKVSGASPWQRFKMITFPLVLPTVLVAMLFRTIAAMRIYGLIETMSSCSTVPSLSCLVVTTFQSRRLGTSAAIAFLTAAIIGLLVMVYIVRFRESQSRGEQ